MFDANKNKKVFCINCAWYSNDECLHKNNLDDTYEKPNSIIIAKPKELNSNNDCPDFEIKLSFFEFLSLIFKSFLNKKKDIPSNETAKTVESPIIIENIETTDKLP